MSTNEQQPGLVTGHAKLAGGVVEEAIGNLTGNTSWQSAGQELKQGGINELKSYQDSNPPTGNETTAGKIEQTIGSAVGCEGMVNEGQGSTAATSTTTSGTTGRDGTINPSDNITHGGTTQPGFGTGGASPADGSRGESRLV